VAYTRFGSALRNAPAVDKFLNIELEPERPNGYILEPDAVTMLGRMIPQYLSARMRAIMLDAYTSEHTSRMLAMKTATDNADDMIGTLTLAMNKARQFAITKEVLEIAMSAEAVKG
jgi:F-type H+-transporting ATPase subunit gamma